MAGVNLQKLNPEIGSEGDKEQWKETHKAVVDRWVEVQASSLRLRSPGTSFVSMSGICIVVVKWKKREKASLFLSLGSRLWQHVTVVHVLVTRPFLLRQCLRGDQAEGLHQLGHRSERGRPHREHREEPEPCPPSVHHGQGIQCLTVVLLNILPWENRLFEVQFVESGRWYLFFYW